jgi:carboxymethylenebutenolidase
MPGARRLRNILAAPILPGGKAMCLGTECEHEDVDRRSFLAAGSAVLAGLGTTTVAGAGGEKEPPPTRVLDDTSVRHGRVTFKSGKKEIDGYLARPKAKGKYPAVLVVAGNSIAEEYIANTCAALAVAGYVGLAPNIFHVVPKDATPEEMNKSLAGRTDVDYLRDIHAGADHLKGHEAVRVDSMGILGFCSGGRRALLYAVRFDDVGAVVAFHTAAHTKPEEVVGLKVPVQLHHGKADRVSPPAVSLALSKQLRSQRTPVEVFLYEGAEHGFLAYTRHPEYNPDAAREAWKRTVAFLNRTLKKK